MQLIPKNVKVRGLLIHQDKSQLKVSAAGSLPHNRVNAFKKI